MLTGPVTTSTCPATLGTLREAGLSWAETDRAWNAMDSHIYGFTLQLQNFPVDPEEYASAAANYLPMLPVEKYPYMHELTKQVISGSHDGTHDFLFGLELILDGLDRLRAR
ncbi:MAG: TetR/AcrR family transcriptional regulator C-terminal domain-containing protein [Gemmatimonadaceae bacterium]|nr:TetR/AcrR family transcriptional regulator C-terminal domain-containing protein [Gemmatimonadaceae bacterium]